MTILDDEKKSLLSRVEHDLSGSGSKTTIGTTCHGSRFTFCRNNWEIDRFLNELILYCSTFFSD